MALFALLADFIVLVHFCYVAFTVGGEIVVLLGGWLKWGWVRNLTFRIVHLGAVVLVAGEALAGASCPLTVWEYRLRVLAGQGAQHPLSFVARLVRSIIFYDLPAWVFLAAYVAFAAAVGLTFLFVAPAIRRTPRGRDTLCRR